MTIPTTPKLDKFFTVIVEGGTTISRHNGDRKSRHIKGTMRAATMDTLSKVTPSYLQHHKLSLMHQDVYFSGNRDGIGCSKRVLQQISSEGKRLLRLDVSCLSSHDTESKYHPGWKGHNPLKVMAKGYIQSISADPFYVTLFNEAVSFDLQLCI